MTSFFKWSDEYNFNIKEIDSQHRHFVSLLDSVYQSILNSSLRTLQSDLLDSLVSYATGHFETEEKYFAEFNYEGAAEHIAEHEKLKEKVLKFQKEFKEGKVDISSELIDFLEDWLLDHLATMDKKYVKCFHDHGLT